MSVVGLSFTAGARKKEFARYYYNFHFGEHGAEGMFPDTYCELSVDYNHL